LVRLVVADSAFRDDWVHLPHDALVSALARAAVLTSAETNHATNRYCNEPRRARRGTGARRVERRGTGEARAVSGNREAIARLTLPELERLLFATLTGMPVETFNAEVRKWIAEAKDPRWKRP
jgi:hypothetical protein